MARYREGRRGFSQSSTFFLRLGDLSWQNIMTIHLLGIAFQLKLGEKAFI